MKIKAKDVNEISDRLAKAQKSISEADYKIEEGADVEALEIALHYTYEAIAILRDNKEHLEDLIVGTKQYWKN